MHSDHMRPVHLLIAAGVGTLGPDRVFPLPPVSVKPLLMTTCGIEKKRETINFTVRKMNEDGGFF